MGSRTAKTVFESWSVRLPSLTLSTSDWGNPGVLARKTKRPRLDLSLGTYVAQPSPKGCSRRSIGGGGEVENGTGMVCPGTGGLGGVLGMQYYSARSNSGPAGWAFPHTL